MGEENPLDNVEKDAAEWVRIKQTAPANRFESWWKTDGDAIQCDGYYDLAEAAWLACLEEAVKVAEEHSSGAWSMKRKVRVWATRKGQAMSKCRCGLPHKIISAEETCESRTVVYSELKDGVFHIEKIAYRPTRKRKDGKRCGCEEPLLPHGIHQCAFGFNTCHRCGLPIPKRKT